MSADDSTNPEAPQVPEAAAETDPLIGTVVADRYRVDRVLGVGGMGTVYAARQHELDRRVALKVISRDVASSATMIERFRREAAATARLRHPNVVTVFDFGALPDGRHYLVMELLTGPPLDAWLAERPSGVGESGMLAVMRPACRAIAALHRAGIVHRDLKPSNIVLPDPEDADDMLKVVDFGIALLRESTASNLTGTAIIGTPGYLAPEVIEGEKADGRSDVYALGVIAYELLCGKTPFSGTTTGAVLLQQLTKDPLPPSRVIGGLSNPLDDVVLHALDRDPDSRYQTADELLEALEAATGPAATAVSTPAPKPAAPPPSRESSAAGASILVIDDDDDLRRLTEAMLVDAGHEVTTAADGIEALLLLGGKTFDLVLSDVDMPNLDGFKLLELVSAKGITTPVIFITGRTDAENELRGLELGAVDYVHKPINDAILLARVKKALGRRGP